MEQELPKHHYIPVLYLKQWAKADGRFTEFSRPAGRSEVEPRGTGARGTGYQRGLYRLTREGIPEELAEAVERKFMQAVDNRAKDALNKILANRDDWTLKTRSDWSRFVSGLLFRVPERVMSARKYLEDFWLDDHERHLAEYNAQKAEGAPEFLDYVVDSIARETLEFTMKQIDNQRIGTKLNSMRWLTVDMSSAGRPLFTSDRPVIMSNGLSDRESHLVIPVSPTKLFIATNNAEMERELSRVIPARELVKMCNRHVIRRAQKYAWNRDDTEMEFVRKHLSQEADLDELFWRTQPQRVSTPNRSLSNA
ncbi:DUF4238 domain-containing protein [Bradyrhizobium yuanmingense]|uniref:DUF4238 domain-containing protein n=1 Tax=Bradyrhizobium yuanmingense TaxID=108015 RepID=UPI0023B90DC4|nr:DUF4238 domain-containing protein [Bradyrhizobium yuanmingense]MDF0584735.1 DUF4238 domain-containing protein [Bradyrhizobium yuanmingense]